MDSPAVKPLAAWLLLVALHATLLAAFPKSTGYVSDFAGVLDGDARAELAALLRETEQQTSAEIALVTVPSLDGLTVEDYAVQLFKAWGIGKRGKDNGVLVLVAPTEKKMRIEVGYGLEPVLPDGLAGDLIRTDFLPEFRSNDYPAGIRKGVRHVVEIVQRNQPLSSGERRRLTERAEDRPPMFVMIPFFGIFIALGAFSFGLGIRAKSFFPLIFGGMFGGIPFLMSLIPFFNAPTWVLGPLGLGMLVLGYTKGDSPGWRKTLRGSSRSHDSSTGWVMGASSGSSDGGSGSSGGGGGFGGGSSGGGGASGSW